MQAKIASATGVGSASSDTAVICLYISEKAVGKVLDDFFPAAD